MDSSLTAAMPSFLVEAKRRTYAGMDDDSSVSDPLLDGSTQLEWRNGSWFYRDIYYGMSFFNGMEVVYFEDKPVWAMTYSGGVLPGIDVEEARKVYGFLRSALMLVAEEFPVRGPSIFSRENASYSLASKGDLNTFSGREEVSIDQSCKYELSFSGGLVR